MIALARDSGGPYVPRPKKPKGRPDSQSGGSRPPCQGWCLVGWIIAALAVVGYFLKT